MAIKVWSVRCAQEARDMAKQGFMEPTIRETLLRAHPGMEPESASLYAEWACSNFEERPLDAHERAALSEEKGLQAKRFDRRWANWETEARGGLLGIILDMVEQLVEGIKGFLRNLGSALRILIWG